MFPFQKVRQECEPRARPRAPADQIPVNKKSIAAMILVLSSLKLITAIFTASEADDLAEELYQGVMRCYQQMDRRAEVLAVYRRMRQTLSITMESNLLQCRKRCIAV
jgi:hypothetical protein